MAAPWPLGAHSEASLRQHTGEAFEQEHAIARWAASVIRPGENILLDAGSTAGAMAQELRGFEKLSVTTPGINTMQELADSEGIEVARLALPLTWCRMQRGPSGLECSGMRGSGRGGPRFPAKSLLLRGALGEGLFTGLLSVILAPVPWPAGVAVPSHRVYFASKAQVLVQEPDGWVPLRYV
jgi:hypothetical protein